MAWGDLNRIATALEGIGVQLTRIADQLGAPAAEVRVTNEPDPTAADLDLRYRDEDLLVKAQAAEETLTLLLGRPPSEDEITRALALDTDG